MSEKQWKWPVQLQKVDVFECLVLSKPKDVQLSIVENKLKLAAIHIWEAGTSQFLVFCLKKNYWFD